VSTLVSCDIDGGVATLRMDDGKVNVLSPAMQAAINDGLDRAEQAGAVVVLTGRERVFCGGFDLATLRGGGQAASGMLRGGFALAERVLTFPRPVISACNGHAIAMGLFLMISADYRIGAEGPFKLTANEVAIGMPLPQCAIDICEGRLNPAFIGRMLGLAEVFGPDEAVPVGILDRTVPHEDLVKEAQAQAGQLAELDAAAHRVSKLRFRDPMVAALRASMDAEFPEGASLPAGAGPRPAGSA
jgi:enoyl-CoA hydratase